MVSRLNYLAEELVADNGSVVGAVAAISFSGAASSPERRDGVPRLLGFFAGPGF